MDGIRGEGFFSGSPVPIDCPACGDRMFRTGRHEYGCELCGAVVHSPKPAVKVFRRGTRRSTGHPLQAIAV